MKAFIKPSKDKQWFYILTANNGKVLVTSETMKRKGSCSRAIKKNFPSFKIVQA